MQRTVLRVVGLLSLLLVLGSCDLLEELIGGGGNTNYPPLAPQGVIATAGNGQVIVSWSSVNGASSYRVYYTQGTSVFTNSQTRQEVSASPCTITALANGTQYAFGVTAINAYGESAISMVQTATPTAGGGPGPVVVDYAPPVPAVSATTSSSITLTWSMVSDPAGDPALNYQVFRSATETGTYTKVATITPPVALTYTDSPLLSGQTKWYKLKALFADATLSAFSPAVKGVATAAITFAAPTNLRTTGTTNYSISIMWDTASGAYKYELYRDTNSSFSGAMMVYSGQGTSYTDYDSLMVGTPYYYGVKAFYTAGTSPMSASINASLSATLTPPNPPTTIYFTPTQTTLQLNWEPSPGAASYIVYKNIGTVTNQFPAPTTTFTDSGLTPDTNYYYQVSAWNTMGEGVKSVVMIGRTLPAGVTATAPATPTGLVVSTPAMNPGSSLYISWSANFPAAMKYVLYRDSMYNGSYTYQVTETISTSFTDNNLTSGTTYYYKVKAGNSYPSGAVTNWLWSGLSAWVSGSTQYVAVNYPPYAPNYPYPENAMTMVDPTMITMMNWDFPGDPEDDALTFDMFVAPAGGTYYQKLNNSQSTSWMPPAGFFSYNTTYQWYVVVHDAVNATVGPTWTFTTKPVGAGALQPSVNLYFDPPQTTYVVGTPVSFNSSIWSNNTPQTYVSGSWYLERPSGSSVTLMNTTWYSTGTTNSFVPDVAGSYYLYLTGIDGTMSSSSWLYMNVVSASQGGVIINLQ